MKAIKQLPPLKHLLGLPLILHLKHVLPRSRKSGFVNGICKGLLVEGPEHGCAPKSWGRPRRKIGSEAVGNACGLEFVYNRGFGTNGGEGTFSES